MTLSDCITDIFHFLYSAGGPLLPDDDESSRLAHLDSRFLRRGSWGGMSGKINDILIDSRHTTVRGRDVDERLQDKDGLKPCLDDL